MTGKSIAVHVAQATIPMRMKEGLTRLGRVTGLVPRIFAVKTRLAALGPENAVGAFRTSA